MEIGTEAAQFLEKEYINGIFLAVQSAASPVSLNLLALLDLFSSPSPRRCDASNSGISQSQSRPTLQPEEECRNIKGFKHREKVIKSL
jgi:hypothetical protein